jgi:hypothetical protein
MKKRLFIIGNGFDLSLGLESSYKHFLTWYLKKCVKKTYEKKQNSHEIKISEFSYENELIELKIPTHIGPNRLSEILDKFSLYNEISGYLKKEGFLKFRCKLLKEIDKDLNKNNWIDIENCYYDTLLSIIDSREYKIQGEKIIAEYNNNFEILKDELVEYLKQIKFNYNNEKFWSFMENYWDRLKIEDSNEDKSQYLFLNFNYTNTLEESLKVLSIDRRSYAIIPIHGKLNDRDSVIFGYGDEMDENYSRLESIRGTESFKNIKLHQYSKSNNYKKFKKFIDSEYDVYILGHSCGIADRTLLSKIFDSKNCLSIKIFHHNGDFDSKSIEIGRHFKIKGDQMDKIESFNKMDTMPQFSK